MINIQTEFKLSNKYYMKKIKAWYYDLEHFPDVFRNIEFDSEDKYDTWYFTNKGQIKLVSVERWEQSYEKYKVKS